MDIGNRRNRGSSYTKEQIKKVISGSGISIESEVDSDYIIFCPFHNNYRSPAGEVDKNSGFFFCFSCQHVCGLVELIMHTSGRSYFEAVRYIKSKETDSNLEQQIEEKLFTKPVYTQFDEFTIKRLNSQALESPRAMR
jgi:DNA primase